MEVLFASFFFQEKGGALFPKHLPTFSSSQIRKDVRAMYAVERVMDHVEVFDREGKFLFSADTLQEAQSILSEEYYGEF